MPAQVTKGLVNGNVHPTQAELSDGAGAPGYKHILQLSQAVFEGVQIRFSCSTATLHTGFTKILSVCWEQTTGETQWCPLQTSQISTY